MKEGAEFIQSWINWIFWVLLIVVCGNLFINTIQINDFAKTSTDVISRYGGLTPKAQSIISDYSAKYYQNRFSVTTMSGAKSQSTVNYGDNIEYIVQSGFLFNNKLTYAKSVYQAQSNVRNNSQN